jgi:biotin synthase-like enzyme
MNNHLKQIKTKMRDGRLLNYGETVRLLQVEEWEALFAAADNVGKKFTGSKVFTAGVNAASVGNYLTTVGNRISDDLPLLKSLGLEV